MKNNTIWIEQTSAYSSPIGGASSSPLVNGIQGDTIFLDLTYKRYYSSISYPPPQIFGNFSSGILIREDSGRVYYRDVSNPGIVSDLLLYDFTKTAGDFVSVYPIDVTSPPATILCSNPVGDGSCIKQVDSVFYISINGFTRKVLRFQQALDTTKFTYWIEGIGSTSGFGNPLGEEKIDLSQSLVCMTQSDTIQFETSSVFSQLPGISYWGNIACIGTPMGMQAKQKTQRILLYPNPTEDGKIHLIADASNLIESVQVHDLSGKIIFSIDHPNQEILLPYKGFFILKVKTQKQGVSSYRVVY